MVNVYKWKGVSGSLSVLGYWLESTDGGATYVAATSLPTSADTIVFSGGTVGLSGALRANTVSLPGGATTVSSPGSAWTLQGTLSVAGYTGPADAPIWQPTSLKVTNGGAIQAAISSGNLTLGPKATLTVDGSGRVEVGATGGSGTGYLTVDAGNQLHAAGGSTINANVDLRGVIFVADGAPVVINGNVMDLPIDAGQLEIGLGATLIVNGSVSASVAVGFASWLGTIAIGASFSGSISEFNATDTIDLTALPYAGTAATYAFANNVLTVAEGAHAQKIAVGAHNGNLATDLTLSSDGAGGTDVKFTNASTFSPFTLWSAIGSNVFATASGPVTGQLWGAATVDNSGVPVIFDDYTAAATYVAGQAAAYNIALTTEDSFGDMQTLVPVATETMVNPFGVGGALGAESVFSTVSGVGIGAVYYWGPSATAGAYDLVFQTDATTDPQSPTAKPSTALTGAANPVIQRVSGLQAWASSTSSSALVIGYATTTGAAGGSANIYLQAFSTTGAALTSPTLVGSVPLANASAWTICLVTDNFSLAYYQNGGIWTESFNASTGAVGTPVEQLAVPAFASVSSLGNVTMANGMELEVVQGVLAAGGQAVDVYNVGTGQLTSSFPLQSTTDHAVSFQTLSDPNDSAANDTVIAYADNDQVHLELLDENGVQIGSDFIVPGLTAFDSIHAMGSRVEILYTTTNADGSQQVGAVIYDTRGQPLDANGTLGGEVAGSPFSDIFVWSLGVYTIDGDDGSDWFQAFGFDPTQVDIAIDAQGDVVFSDGVGDVATLRRFAEIGLSNNTIEVEISGDTLTYASGGTAYFVETWTYDAEGDYSITANGTGGTVTIDDASATVSGGGNTVDFTSGAANAARLINAAGDVVTSENGATGTVYLTHAGASIYGSFEGAEFWGGADNAASLIDAVGDVVTSANGATGTVFLTHAGASIYGSGEGAEFWGGADNAASLINASGDVVTSANGATGTVYLTHAGASIYGSGEAAQFWGGSDNAASLINASGDVVTSANGATGTVFLTHAGASIYGSGEAAQFWGGSDNAASLINASGDVVTSANGATGTVYLTHAGASIYGSGEGAEFWGGADNAASLINASGDVVTSANGATGTVYLTHAGASIYGSGEAAQFWGGSDNAASLINASGDVVTSANGATGTVYLTHAGASIYGSFEGAEFWGGSDNAASLINASGDVVTSANGATGTVYLTHAGASIYGSFEAAEFWGGADNAASLIDASGDVVRSANGATGTVYLTHAGASIYGGGDGVEFWGGADNAASLIDTAGVADTVTSANGATGSVYLTDASASVFGDGDAVTFWGGTANTATLSGTGDAISFHQAAFGLDTVSGYTSGDSLTFALADQGHLTIAQSGANTTITLDAGDVVTLTNVQATSVSLSQLHFA